METGNALAILREFAQLRPTATTKTTAWKWATGVIRFPDSYCPWCLHAMSSNRIWLVDNVGRKLLGQVKLDGSRLIKERPLHPHVSGVTVCMKEAVDVYQALFIAWNTDSMHWAALDPRQLKYYSSGVYAFNTEYAKAVQKWIDWLDDVFDHTCLAKNAKAGGLSAELSRSEQPAEPLTPPAVPLAANEVAAPVVDNTPIFTPGRVIPVAAQQPSTLDELPIFGREARRRKSRLNRTTERGLFDGSMDGGGGISAD